MTKQNQPEIEMSQKPVVIDVFATWCGPCMEMKPIFEELAAKHSNQYTFAMLNVDENRELAIHYGVSAVPTVVFMKDGKVQGKKVGYMSGEDLLDAMQEYFG